MCVSVTFTIYRGDSTERAFLTDADSEYLVCLSRRLYAFKHGRYNPHYEVKQ